LVTPSSQNNSTTLAMPGAAKQVIDSDDELALAFAPEVQSLNPCSGEQERARKTTEPLHSHGSIPVAVGIEKTIAHTPTGLSSGGTESSVKERCQSEEGLLEAAASQLNGEVFLAACHPSQEASHITSCSYDATPFISERLCPV